MCVFLCVFETEKYWHTNVHFFIIIFEIIIIWQCLSDTTDPPRVL